MSACKDNPVSQEKSKGNIIISIKNEADQGIEGVEVGEEKVLTDGSGFARIEISDTTGYKIKFFKEDYAPTYKITDVKASKDSYIDAYIFKYKSFGIPADSAKEINYNGLTLKFPKSGYNNKLNNEIVGKVNANVLNIHPYHPLFFEGFPGEFKGLRKTGSETYFESMGFFSVNLKQEKNDVFLQQGKEIEAVLEVSQKYFRAQLPDNIPVWKFNEESGVWNETSAAQKNQSGYS
jgi:hypothetical protein